MRQQLIFQLWEEGMGIFFDILFIFVMLQYTNDTTLVFFSVQVTY